MKIYHGDNFDTTKIDIKLMNNGNNQEGIGIYFSTNFDTAKHYGVNIVYASINSRRFIDSRKTLKEVKIRDVVENIILELSSDAENMYYFLSDYYELSEPDDVKQYHLLNVWQYLKDEQVRNFQISMADRFGTEAFVNAWNKYSNIYGTFQKQGNNEIWFAIINDKIKLERIKS